MSPMEDGALLEIVGWGCSVILDSKTLHSMLIQILAEYTGNRNDSTLTSGV